MLNEPGQTAGAGDCDNAPRVHWRLAGEAPSGVVWPSVSERSLAAIENNSHRALRGHSWDYEGNASNGAELSRPAWPSAGLAVARLRSPSRSPCRTIPTG